MQRKILIVLVLNIIVVSVTLSVVSYITIHESIDRSLQNRIALARVISNYVEALLHRSLNRLHDIARAEHVNLYDKDQAPKRRMLETAYKYSLFTEGVFLLDKHGNKIMTYPSDIEQFMNLTYIPSVNQVLQSGNPVVSDVYTIAPINKKVIFIMTPLKDRNGMITGIAGGLLSPTSDVLQNLLKSAITESDTYLDIIDSNEVVVASDNPSHVLQHHDHGSVLSKMIRDGRSGMVECSHGFTHPNAKDKKPDLLAVVPFRIAPWGIVLGQAEKDVFAPALTLQTEFFALVLVFTVASLLLSFIMSRKIVSPLRSLISSTNRIASGDLDTPVGNVGSDEILKLSTSFDDMRKRLAESLEKIRTHNAELESRVAIRTHEIRESRKRVRHLLKKSISSQEEERRRIARELHDTILQEASAFLIQLDICRMHPELISVQKIDEMKVIAVGIIDGIHRVIDDLRPSLLDDLGIDAAMMWLLKKHLSDKGINFYLDFKSPLIKKMLPEAEILVFRIVQEVLVNIARHANAHNVFISAEANEASLTITIEDDGIGFDMHELIDLQVESGRGLGLTGMRERAKLLGGKLMIYSQPDEGTRICIQVPLEVQTEHA